ncbi:MAG: hypothetical protein KatS3mg013_0754 [Actinomycetota bacterium]|nr:MAG: hypothetical protein KatS3mg013_0754 [Actinomycetota bacterium]
MAQVTCPACGTRQPIEAAAAGYACGACGVAWAFVACRSCRRRFHARRGAGSWRCPSCGAQNTPAPSTPTTAPRPRIRSPRRSPAVDLRRAAVAAGAVVLIVVVAFALVRRGDEPTPATTGTASPSVDPAQALCAHLGDIQALRFDALGRAAKTLKADAETIEASGDPELARDVRRLVRAVRALRAAQATPEIDDDQEATAAVLEALEPLPC